MKGRWMTVFMAVVVTASTSLGGVLYSEDFDRGAPGQSLASDPFNWTHYVLYNDVKLGLAPAGSRLSGICISGPACTDLANSYNALDIPNMPTTGVIEFSFDIVGSENNTLMLMNSDGSVRFGLNQYANEPGSPWVLWCQGIINPATNPDPVGGEHYYIISTDFRGPTTAHLYLDLDNDQMWVTLTDDNGTLTTPNLYTLSSFEIPTRLSAWVTRAGGQIGMQVDNIAISTSEPTATVQGTVALGDYTGDGSAHPAPVAVRVSLTGPTTGVFDRMLDADGRFTIENIIPGQYTVAVKSYAHLQKTRNVTVATGATDLGVFDLISGDLDGDNAITSTDLSIILMVMDMVGN